MIYEKVNKGERDSIETRISAWLLYSFSMYTIATLYSVYLLFGFEALPPSVVGYTIATEALLYRFHGQI